MKESRKFQHVSFDLPDLEINPEGDLLLIDKPYNCTSFDVVGKVRKMATRIAGHHVKVGHAGTLDPLATGLLIICVGRMTKQVDVLQTQEKTYTGTFRMGATTPSFDLEKPVDATYPYGHITREMVGEAVRALAGDIRQVPPVFSAVKHQGERSYLIARRGEEARLTPRNVTIYEFEITRFELPDIDFRVRCSKGTYIRALARDFGEALGSGAHLTALRRTRIGNLCVEDAVVPVIREQKTIQTGGRRESPDNTDKI